MRPRPRRTPKSSVLTACVLALGLPGASCSAGRTPSLAAEPQFFPSPEPALAAFPFSEAVLVGELLFVSGQIGNAPGSAELVPGGIVPESKQAPENIRVILARHGSSLDQVVKCTVFLADMHDWPAVNDVYRAQFRGRFPARSVLGASGLARGARVEVECLAFVPQGPRSDS